MSRLSNYVGPLAATLGIYTLLHVLFAVLTLPLTILLHDCYGGLVFVEPRC